MTRSRLYLMLQAVVCVALAAWLSLSAIGIWREGSARKAEHPMESVYTPQAVAEKCAPIAPLLAAGTALLVAGLALGVKDESAGKPVKDAALQRDLLAARVAMPSEAMRVERRRQRRLLWIGWGAFALCMAPVAAHLLNPAHFPQDDLEGMFFALMRVLLPWTAVGLGALAVCSALSACPVDPPKPAGLLRAVLILAAIAFIIAGVFNGSARDVLYKAVTICTECVGLG